MYRSIFIEVHPDGPSLVLIFASLGEGQTNIIWTTQPPSLIDGHCSNYFSSSTSRSLNTNIVPRYEVSQDGRTHVRLVSQAWLA